MGKNDVNQIADNVRVVHAGCGVNALSGLQSHQSHAHNLIDVVVGKLRPNRHWRHSLRW